MKMLSLIMVIMVLTFLTPAISDYQIKSIKNVNLTKIELDSLKEKIEITTNPMQSDIPAIKETENFKELGTNIKFESSNLMDTKYLSLKTETYLHNTNFITKNLKDYVSSYIDNNQEIPDYIKEQGDFILINNDNPFIKVIENKEDADNSVFLVVYTIKEYKVSYKTEIIYSQAITKLNTLEEFKNLTEMTIPKQDLFDYKLYSIIY